MAVFSGLSFTPILQEGHRDDIPQVGYLLRRPSMLLSRARSSAALQRASCAS
jgi:hypothetical protein